MGARERRELFSDPPEHQEGDELDSIGLHEGGRKRSARRGISERGGHAGSSRSAATPEAAKSKREKQNLARQKVRKLIPVGVLLGIALLAGVALMIPGLIRNRHLAALASDGAQARETAAHNLKGDSALAELRARVESGKPEGPGGAAAMALAHSGPAGLEALKAAAAAQDPGARSAAAFGLGLTRSPMAAETLAALLARDQDAAVRAQAARSLGMIRAPAAVAALVDHGDAETQIRDAALASLLTAACPEAREQLVAGLSAGSEEMRTACRRALLVTGADAGIGRDDILKLAGSEKAPVRAGAVKLAAVIKGSPFAEMLPKALADESELVRAAAAEAAELLGWAAAREPLEKAVATPGENLRFRVAAARALGSIGMTESLPALAGCLAAAGQPEEARAAAAEAVTAIARRHKFWKLSAKGEHNDSLTHLKLCLAAPDPRWEALTTIVAACDSFKGEALTARGFAALQALAGRRLAPKPEVWKAWMAGKLEEGRVLGEVYHLFDAAYRLGTRNTAARVKADAAMRLAKGLRRRAEKEDQAFFQALFDDLCGVLGLNAKEEYQRDDPPPAPPPEKKPEEPGAAEAKPAEEQRD